MRTDIDLTFGLELEFLIVYPEQRIRQVALPYVGDNPASVMLYRLLHDQLISVAHFENLSDSVDNSDYTYWNVGRDDHELREAELKLVPRGYKVDAIELSSRKLSMSRDNWTEELKTVLSTFAEFERQGCRLITNIETGFHVHIGNNTSGFPLRTVKNIYTLATAFERCIDSLHTTHRIQHGNIMEPMNPSNPPSFFFYNTDNDRYLRTWLEDIEGFETLDAFLDHFVCEKGRFANFTNGKSAGINFDNLRPAAPFALASMNTIEFRQHAGTLDFNDICAWTLTVAQLVAWSHYTDQTRFDAFLNTTFLDVHFRMLQLLDT